MRNAHLRYVSRRIHDRGAICTVTLMCYHVTGQHSTGWKDFLSNDSRDSRQKHFLAIISSTLSRVLGLFIFLDRRRKFSSISLSGHRAVKYQFRKKLLDSDENRVLQNGGS
jgi:hypothetical protein